MHTFQPYPIELLELNPFVRIGKEGAILTSGDKKKSNPMTISWGGIGVLWGKNVAFVFVRESRFTKTLIDDHRFFSISFLKEDCRRDALEYCGKYSGRDEDKWQGSGLTPAFKLGIPYPDESELVILCHSLGTMEISPDTFLNNSIQHHWYQNDDYHTVYIGEILEVLAR